MKKLTTFQIVLMAVFGAMALSGVLIFALLTSGSSTSSLGAVVIWGTLPESSITPIIRGTVDTDNRFSGVTYVQHDPAKYEADLTNALASGRGPDLFIMRDDRAMHDSSYALHFPYTSLSQDQFASTFLDAANVFLGKDGTVAIPFLVDPLVLYWNKDALAAAGYTKPPIYWKEIPPMMQKLVKKSDAGSIEKAGIALGEFDNIHSAKAILATMILQAGGAIIGPDKNGQLKSLLGSQEGLSAGVTALSFYTEFADPLRDDYTWTRAFPDAAAAFAAGDAAMYIGFASERSFIQRSNPNLNFDLAPLPQGDPQVKSSKLLGNAHVYGLSIARNSQNPQGALTIAYLMAAQDIASKISEALDMTTALRSVGADAAPQGTDDASKALQNLVKSAPKTQSDMLNFEASIARTWADPDSDRTDAIFRSMIEDVVSGAQKPTESVQRADAQINDILGP